MHAIVRRPLIPIVIRTVPVVEWYGIIEVHRVVVIGAGGVRQAR